MQHHRVPPLWPFTLKPYSHSLFSLSFSFLYMVGCAQESIVLSSHQLHHLFSRMYLSSLIPLVFSVVHSARSQSSTSSYVEPTVPTGAPIPGDYSGTLRPQIHYSPPIDFMVRRCKSTPGSNRSTSFTRDPVDVRRNGTSVFEYQKWEFQLCSFSDTVVERS